MSQHPRSPQDTQLFNATIAENIGYGAPGGSYTMAELEAAARAAQAHEFISGFEDGYQTKVGRHGEGGRVHARFNALGSHANRFGRRTVPKICPLVLRFACKLGDGECLQSAHRLSTPLTRYARLRWHRHTHLRAVGR